MSRTLTFSHWLYEERHSAAFLTLNRPQIHNAMDDTTVIEVMSQTRMWPGFKAIAHAVGCPYHCFISGAYDRTQTASVGSGNEDFHIEIETFSRFVESCLPFD